jgi:hypothetical protein
MSRPIGLSTGALAKGDFRRGLQLQDETSSSAVELSALRVSELRPLIDAKDDLDLSRYEYVSFHAPSRFSAEEEAEVVEALSELSGRNWPIVLHPDTIHDFTH